MARLIVLNGPPGIGKSTLARMYVDDHPLAFNLDIDRIRALLGGWRDNLHEAGLRARAIAVAAARTHLDAGRDVVVPQFVARAEFLDQMAAVASQSGAEYREVVLMDGKANALRRFESDPAHVHATMPSGGFVELSDMYDRLAETVARRPHAIVVPSVYGQVAETYRDLMLALA